MLYLHMYEQDAPITTMPIELSACDADISVNVPLWLTLDVAGIVVAFVVGVAYLGLSLAVRRSVPRWAVTAVSINGLVVLAAGALITMGYWEEYDCYGDEVIEGPTMQLWRHAAPYPYVLAFAAAFVLAGMVTKDMRLRAMTGATCFGLIAVTAAAIPGNYGLQAFALPYALLALVIAVDGWKTERSPVSLPLPPHDLPREELVRETEELRPRP